MIIRIYPKTLYILAATLFLIRILIIIAFYLPIILLVYFPFISPNMLPFTLMECDGIGDCTPQIVDVILSAFLFFSLVFATIATALKFKWSSILAHKLLFLALGVILLVQLIDFAYSVPYFHLPCYSEIIPAHVHANGADCTGPVADTIKNIFYFIAFIAISLSAFLHVKKYPLFSISLSKNLKRL